MSTYQDDERAAPIEPNAKPPYEATTLRWIAQLWPELKWQYAAKVDGSGFRRCYINRDDPNLSDYLEQRADGRIIVLLPGETRASMEAKEREKEASMKAYHAEIKRLEDAQAAKNQADLEAKLARKDEIHRQEMERIRRRSYAS